MGLFPWTLRCWTYCRSLFVIRPRSFFGLRPYMALVWESFFHRKRQNVPAKTLGRIHALVNIYRMNLGVLLQSTEVDEHRFPFLDIEVSDLSPEDMVQHLRAL